MEDKADCWVCLINEFIDGGSSSEWDWSPWDGFVVGMISFSVVVYDPSVEGCAIVVSVDLTVVVTLVVNGVEFVKACKAEQLTFRYFMTYFRMNPCWYKISGGIQCTLRDLELTFCTDVIVGACDGAVKMKSEKGMIMLGS